MRVDNDFLTLEGPEVFAYNRMFCHLFEDMNIEKAMKLTWTEVAAQDQSMALDISSRAAIMEAALRTYGAYLIIKALRKDLDNLTIYDLAREQAKIVLVERKPTHGDRAVEGGRFPSEQDKKIIPVGGGIVAHMEAHVKPAGSFRRAVGVARALGTGAKPSK